MVVGVLQVELFIPEARSLKDKRRVVSSLKERLHRSSHVAVAEVDRHDRHQVAVLGVVAVANESARAQSVLDRIVNRLREDTRFVLSDHVSELIQGRIGA